MFPVTIEAGHSDAINIVAALSNRSTGGIMMPEANPTRVCKHCSGPVPCKPCTLARLKRWAEAEPERVRAYKAAYEARHPERVKAAKLSYYNRKRDQVLASKAAYEARYPERVKESKRAYYLRNKVANTAKQQKRREENRDEERSRYRKQYANDPTPFLVRARRRDERNKEVGGRFTTADKCALFQLQRGLCANPFCEADLSEGFHADHKVPVARGGSHDPANRQLLCPTCNHRKGALTNEEWLSRQKAESA